MKRRSVGTPVVQMLYVGSLDSTTGTFVIPFRFAAPGPRVMLTAKLIAQQRFGAVPFDWTFGGTVSWFLWLCRSILTDDGQRVPVQNIYGTRANPVRLDNGTITDSVNGQSVDWTGGGDGLDGEVTMVVSANSGSSSPTLVSLRGRYNAVAPLCDDEWNVVAARAGSSPDVRFGGKIGTVLG